MQLLARCSNEIIRLKYVWCNIGILRNPKMRIVTRIAWLWAWSDRPCFLATSCWERRTRLLVYYKQCNIFIRLSICNIRQRSSNLYQYQKGFHCSFYVISSISEDITFINEIVSFDVPMQIKELNNLNIVEELKQMSKIYYGHCLKRYISELMMTLM